MAPWLCLYPVKQKQKIVINMILAVMNVLLLCACACLCAKHTYYVQMCKIIIVYVNGREIFSLKTPHIYQMMHDPGHFRPWLLLDYKHEASFFFYLRAVKLGKDFFPLVFMFTHSTITLSMCLPSKWNATICIAQNEHDIRERYMVRNKS